MTDDAAKFVGSIPEHYDRYLGPRIFADFAQDLAARLSQQDPKSVLELAAGTGIVSRAIRDALPGNCELVATDLNEPMLEAAREKFQDAEPIQFRQADAMALPFSDESFDALACQFGVMFFPDKLESYVEAHRVLKPGGRYIFSVWDSWTYNPFAQLAHEAVADFFPANPPGFYKVPFGYRDTDTISASLLEAGFAKASHDVVSIDSAIPSSSDFATGLVFGNPLFDEIIARNGNPDEIRLAVSAAIEAGLGDKMPLQAIVITAEKG
ncbi:MAG: methyltransferase domain-containing protein [Halieaceae bacterium]